MKFSTKVKQFFKVTWALIKMIAMALLHLHELIYNKKYGKINMFLKSLQLFLLFFGKNIKHFFKKTVTDTTFCLYI